VAAVAIPQAIAYASIAELPPHYGLYTAAVGAIVGSLWGSSRFLATGPVNSVSLLVMPLLLSVAAPDTPRYLLAASLLAVMAGAICILLSLLKFGALVTLASRAVLLGFTAGAAVHIAIGQVRHLLGIQVKSTPQLYRTASGIAAAASDVHWVTLSIGFGALILVVLLSQINRKVPAALLVIALAAGVVHFLGLSESGVKVVGHIPRSIPIPTWISTGTWPDLQLVRQLTVGALAVAALGLIEAVAAAQSLARLGGDRLDSNQEFFGQGLAKIAVGLMSGYPCSGSFTRSTLSQQAGARTHLAGVFTGLTVLVGVLLLAPFASLIPRAAIAGVLLTVAWGMVDRHRIKQVLRASRSEAAVMATTFGATLILPLDFAVLAGIAFSLAFFVIRSSLPRVYPVVPDKTFRHFVHDPERPVCPQLGVMNIQGPLFFGAVYHIEEELRHSHEHHPGQNILVLRMHGVELCDMSGIDMLEATVRTYRQRGGDIYLVRPRRPVLDMMLKSDFVDSVLTPNNILEQEAAVEFLFDEVLDPVICKYECEHRIFAECQGVKRHVYGEQMPTAEHSHVHRFHIEPEFFQDLAGNPEALVLDLREPREYSAGHVPGAKLLPLRMLSSVVHKLPLEQPLLMTCRSGRRTARALRMLEGKDFARIYGLRGGLHSWRAHNLPLEKLAFESLKIWPDELDRGSG
jgi:SulP family sulfate permease